MCQGVAGFRIPQHTDPSRILAFPAWRVNRTDVQSWSLRARHVCVWIVER